MCEDKSTCTYSLVYVSRTGAVLFPALLVAVANHTWSFRFPSCAVPWPNRPHVLHARLSTTSTMSWQSIVAVTVTEHHGCCQGTIRPS